MYQKFTVPGPLARYNFLHRITTSGETSREVENAASYAK